MKNYSSTYLFILCSMMLIISMKMMWEPSSLLLTWEFFLYKSSSFEMSLLLDWMSTIYSCLVLFISANVMKFSTYYMKHETYNNRFTWLVMLFILSMNFLIFIPNLMSMLIGWDGLGVTSFILVMYYNNKRSITGSLLTMFTNRMGDLLLISAIILSLNSNSWNLMLLISSSWEQKIMPLMLILAAITKSAQIPFSSWLPAAMAAPTPVSALVHSSTLVTAGVFIIIRFNKVFSNIFSMNMLLTLSLLTTISASLMALLETDLKKMVALSTLSQLGFMMMSISLKMPMLAFFHMCTHAIFKALLFIAVGNLINMNNHNQDSRVYGNYCYSSPMNSIAMLISIASMIGMPFTAGFYSKHKIMEYSNSNMITFLMMSMLIISVMLTTIYSMKMMFFVSLNTPTNNMYMFNSSNHSTEPLFNMMMTSLIFGSAFSWMMTSNINMYVPHMNTFSFLLNMMIIIGMFMTIYLLFMNSDKINKYTYIYLNSMLFMNYLSTSLNFLLSKLSINLYKNNDQCWMEYSYSYNMFNSMLNIWSKTENKIFQFHNFSIPMSFITMFFVILLMITHQY